MVVQVVQWKNGAMVLALRETRLPSGPDHRSRPFPPDWDIYYERGRLGLIRTFSTSEGEGLNNQYQSMKLREAKVTTRGRCNSRACSTTVVVLLRGVVILLIRFRGEGRGVRG